MSYTRGRPLCSEEKKVLISVKHYFDRNRIEFGSSDTAAQMAADALSVGLSTVNRVMASYHKDPDSINVPPQARGRPLYSIDASHQEIVRAYIRKANMEGAILPLSLFNTYCKKYHLTTCFISQLWQELLIVGDLSSARVHELSI